MTTSTGNDVQRSWCGPLRHHRPPPPSPVPMRCTSLRRCSCTDTLTLWIHLPVLQAKKVANHLQKHGAPVDEPDAPLGGRFVWTKKIEKDIASGVSVSEFSRKAEQQRKEDRLVSTSTLPSAAGLQGNCGATLLVCFCCGRAPLEQQHKHGDKCKLVVNHVLVASSTEAACRDKGPHVPFSLGVSMLLWRPRSCSVCHPGCRADGLTVILKLENSLQESHFSNLGVTKEHAIIFET